MISGAASRTGYRGQQRCLVSVARPHSTEFEGAHPAAAGAGNTGTGCRSGSSLTLARVQFLQLRVLVATSMAALAAAHSSIEVSRGARRGQPASLEVSSPRMVQHTATRCSLEQAGRTAQPARPAHRSRMTATAALNQKWCASNAWLTCDKRSRPPPIITALSLVGRTRDERHHP
jgi:hypothetical protein